MLIKLEDPTVLIARKGLPFEERVAKVVDPDWVDIMSLVKNIALFVIAEETPLKIG